MLGAIITTRSLSVNAANPTLKKNKSGKNAYFHFLPFTCAFFPLQPQRWKICAEIAIIRCFFGQNHHCIVGAGKGRLQLKTRDLSEVAFWRKLHTGGGPRS